MTDKFRVLADSVRFSKIDGFFPTPPAVIDRMMELADIVQGMTVLEPSAGIGSLADAVRGLGVEPMVCEIHLSLRGILSAKGYKFLAHDFMAASIHSDADPVVDRRVDRIVMNPPFERGQDIDHVRRAYECLKPGGRLVAVMSAGPFFRQDSKASSFRDWLGDRARVEELPDNAFAGKDAFRQTCVQCRLVVLDK